MAKKKKTAPRKKKKKEKGRKPRKNLTTGIKPKKADKGVPLGLR